MTYNNVHPRPQLVRDNWLSLDGKWDFTNGDPKTRFSNVEFDESIIVPFPPESAASETEVTGSFEYLWYRRSISDEELNRVGFKPGNHRLLIHFGAVDWQASIWFNGHHVADHVGGQTPFSVDVTDYLTATESNELTVHAHDPQRDTSILRGKQDWRDEPHEVWYNRSSGIWQSVWLEAVPEFYIKWLTWDTNIDSGQVLLNLELEGGAAYSQANLRMVVRHQGELVTDVTSLSTSNVATVAGYVEQFGNLQDIKDLLWTPENPVLLDAQIQLIVEGQVVDQIESYFGFRSVEVRKNKFLLNGRPIKLRGVLSQNYWPDSHLAAPSADAYRIEVEKILELGFNFARLHQKAEDPRFAYWADKLGLMLWVETASAFSFNRRAVENLLTEWPQIVRRHYSHPSVIAWVPINESWGVQAISRDKRHYAFTSAMADLTRALDSTRPVISNDGWEHVNSDILTIHDYENDPLVLERRYESIEEIGKLVRGVGPAGKDLTVGNGNEPEENLKFPVAVTEFGGVTVGSSNEPDSWGYSAVSDEEAFTEHVVRLVSIFEENPDILGYCYTQLTDTGSETNGLLDEDRQPKLNVQQLREALRAKKAL